MAGGQRQAVWVPLATPATPAFARAVPPLPTLRQAPAHVAPSPAASRAPQLADAKGEPRPSAVAAAAAKASTLTRRAARAAKAE